MRVLRWPEEEPRLDRASAVTLGVFDGVHRGHASVIERVVEAAGGRGWLAVVVTFDRHPTAVVADRREPVITSLQHRLRLFEGLGVDTCVVTVFGRRVAQMSAESFVREILWERLRARLVVLGFDCRFGRDRQGDAALCRRLGEELGFKVQVVPPLLADGEPVSSTAIREAIQAGALQRAARLLGRPFSLYGTVVPGDGRGKELGCPTANLDLHHEIVPPQGVYVSRAFLDGEGRPAVTSVGHRPTFHRDSGLPPVVEVHLIDWCGNLYGRDIEVAFVRRLRGQRTFETPEALSEQIGRDIARARALLAGEREE